MKATIQVTIELEEGEQPDLIAVHFGMTYLMEAIMARKFTEPKTKMGIAVPAKLSFAETYQQVFPAFDMSEEG